MLAIDERDRKWAEVRIDFTTTERSVSGTYEASVEATTSVKTMKSSGDELSIEAVQQYRLTNLKRVS